MSVIIFVRHGKSEKNVEGLLNSEPEGPALVKEGIEKAKQTAKELRKLKISKVYCSPMLRARQTAEIVCKELKLKPIIDERLADRDLGKMNNKSTMDGEWKFYVDLDEMEVESLKSMQARVISFMESVSKLNEIVVAVSHDGPIKSAITYALDINPLLESGLKPTYATMNVIVTKPYGVLAISYPILTEELIKKINSHMGKR